MSTETRLRRPNGHDAPPILGETYCPACDRPLDTVEHIAAVQRKLRFRDAEIERSIEARYTHEKEKAEKLKKIEIEFARKDAVKHAEKKLALLRASQAATLAAHLAAERENAAKQVAEAVAAAKIEFATEKARLEQQLGDLTRRVQAKTPHALGEPGEVALYSALLSAFPDERCCSVERIARGRAGPDIVVSFMERGTPIGTVVVDCKNYSRWSSKFIPKLKADARALGAQWSILASNVFPKDAAARGLTVVDSVIVSDPAYVVPLVAMLSRHLVELHRQKLTQEAHDEKATALLDFVASADCVGLLQNFAAISDGLLDLDVREVASHQTVWRKRGELIRSLQRSHEALQSAFDAIMNGETVDIEAISV